MTFNECNQLYFDWLYELVCTDTKYSSHRKLLTYLHDVDFVYILPMDENRYADGIGLRYKFGDSNGIPQQVIAKLLDIRDCSVLEMMIALSVRCEEHIMDDPDIGNRTGQWFWDMIVSLGLGTMDDNRFDYEYVKETVRKFLNREYSADGSGGLFTIKDCERDLRDIDIWYQMCWYLTQFY